MTEADTKSGGGFRPDDLEQLKELAELFIQAKGLILYSEEVDPDSRSNLQVIKELRDSHDHVMRVVALRLSQVQPDQVQPENNTVSPDEYCRKNLEKAVGHVYRAAFDALDGTIVSLRQKVTEILKAYPTDVIREVIPEYWEIKITLENLTQTIATHRQKKDVGADVSRSLDDYVSDVECIKIFYTKLLRAGPALDECKGKKHFEETSERSKHRKDHIFSGVVYSVLVAVSGIIGAAIAGYFDLDFGKRQNATPAPQEVIAPPSGAALSAPIPASTISPKPAGK